jgi:dienelactone hydrolase
MTTIALFHSVLGLRPGIDDAAARLRDAGHDVLVVDQYDGRVFDDYEEASAFAEGIGYPALMRRALDAVAGLDDGFIAAGFSNGGGMSEHVALHRRVSGVLMLSGTLPLEMLGGSAWPAGVPAQIHYMLEDPLRHQEWTDAVVGAIRKAGAPLEVYDYPGRGHLFTDPSLPGEYDPEAAALLWERVLAFVDRYALAGAASDVSSKPS